MMTRYLGFLNARARFDVFALLSLALMLCAGQAMAHSVSHDGLTLTHAWTRSVPVAGLNGAGYVTISNRSEHAYRLVSIETQSAAKTSLHESVSADDGMMTMKALSEGVVIPAGQTIELAPGGMHIMLMKMTSSTAAGDHVPATFVFERLGKESPESLRLETSFAVQPVVGDSHTHH